MQKLLQGLQNFQLNVFGSQRELFERLSKGQSPEVLLITCSDSRIDPALITQTQPGDLFVIRNAGNIVPPHGAANGGEGATIEYAVAALGVKDIIVCGHSHCGAMAGLLNLDGLSELPQVRQWLSHAEATRRVVKEKHAGSEGEALLASTVEENVLVQLDNLRTHPAVAAAVSAGKLGLHAWVYKFETGEVFAHDAASGEFKLIADYKPNDEPAASASA